jgi:hypothetical protein
MALSSLLCPPVAVATLVRMGEQRTQERKRYPVKMDDETKRRLGTMAAAAEQRVEDFAGKVFSEAIDRLWADFDPKRADAKPKKSR